MSGNRNHIVAKVKWDTLFDRKEKSVELQDRISRWSNGAMPANIARVFERFCPEAQTWKIEALTIDLGKIDFDNLEQELAKQLNAQLNQKLIDLIVNGNRDHLQIDITENKISQLQVLRHFLLNGLMPWNYQDRDRSIDELLASQLKINLTGVTNLLREIGKNSLEVRKRIAWQTGAHNLVEMVKGLEPSHHEQVIGFSEEIIRIKEKENRIIGNALEFKKNLWLWIFNYLLADRGSLFNKIAFLKCNISQMANYYHVTYNELLVLIKEAVKEVSLRNFVKHELLNIVDQLEIENGNINAGVAVNNVSNTNYWTLLKQHLLNHSTRLSTGKKTELNDLVVSLSKADPARFAALVLTVANREQLTTSLSATLNNTALTAFFVALNPAKATELLRNVNFLVQLNPEIKLKVDQKLVWEIGLRYLLLQTKATLGQANFLSFYVSEISKAKGLKKETIAHRFLSANIPVAIKNVSNLASYLSFNEVLQVENGGQNSLPAISILIEKLIAELKVYPTNSEKLALLSGNLLKSIKQTPKIALNAFIKFENKAALEQVFPYLVDRNSAVLLLQNVDDENTVVFSVFQKIARQFKKDRATHNFAIWLSENLIAYGVEAVVFQPKLTQAKLVAFILKKLKNALPAAHALPFEQFIYALAKEKDSSFAQLNVLFNKNKKQFAIEQLSLAIAAGHNKKAVADVMAGGLKYKEYNFDDLQKYAKRNKIVNYLLTDGMQVHHELVKTYTNMLLAVLPKGKIAAAKKTVAVLFWKCLMAYQMHNSNKQSFKKLYHEAILYHFKLSQRPDKPAYSLAKPPVKSTKAMLNDGRKIDYNQLFTLLETCLQKQRVEIARQGGTLKFEDLLVAALELDPKKVKNLITSFSVNKSLINFWTSAVSFNQFAFLMLDSQVNVETAGIKSLMAWFNLSQHLLAGTMPNDILNDFWLVLLKAIKNDRLAERDLKKIVQTVLFKISVQKSFNSVDIVLGIKNSELEIPALLVQALTSHLPNFANLKLKEKKAMYTERLFKTSDTALIYQLAKELICHKQAPVWFNESSSEVLANLLNEVVTDHPTQFFLILKRENVSEAQYSWLNENISFKTLIKTIGYLNMAQRTALQMIQDFYFALGNVSNQYISTREIQFILFKKLIKAWLSGNWKMLNADHIWQELIWEIGVDKKTDQHKLIESFGKIKFQLPPAIQITLSQIEEQQRQLKVQPKKEVTKRKLPEIFMTDTPEILKEGIHIQNAGLVLINQYIPMLFERLGLTDANKAYLPNKQQDAVHYLQFVATGQTETEEHYLVLNKILCGMQLREPVKNEIEISHDDIELIEQLLQAMIGHWDAIGSTSIEGFRGNWLIRDGLLIEYDDKWELVIEKRAYDLLINQSPFTFSVIKYPWMTKPLYVQWPH